MGQGAALEGAGGLGPESTLKQAQTTAGRVTSSLRGSTFAFRPAWNMPVEICRGSVRIGGGTRGKGGAGA